MANWYEMLEDLANENNESVLNCTLSDEELKEEFSDGYGCSNGKPFTAWGNDWVYFPVVYDGAEWVGCAPRNPCDISTEHQGGE